MSTYMYIVYRNVGASANVFLILEQKNKNKDKNDTCSRKCYYVCVVHCMHSETIHPQLGFDFSFNPVDLAVIFLRRTRGRG